MERVLMKSETKDNTFQLRRQLLAGKGLPGKLPG